MDAPDEGPTLRFTDLGLSETMLAALAAVNYEMPSPVQAGIIPLRPLPMVSISAVLLPP